ncbi:hypothetical protein M3A49_36770 [Paraburkholderia sp. CNPSo 3076]|uniref:hypothetical protein n=1 Tax=Paraburkholderia sp. CNPSo 3076 TaxID=2940936 RepID=UPI0022539CDE|nr:hypothetical protein [Paraburkholderia sp. CNPSo 3076]MCX5544941.1 hypothetical protein [Paraburkholderia sp. CNPSo 3076]
MPDHLIETVRQAAEAQSLQHDMCRLDLELRGSVSLLRRRRHEKLARVQSEFGFDSIVRSPGSPLDPVCSLAAKLVRYDLSLLILGESGTGKVRDFPCAEVWEASPVNSRRSHWATSPAVTG